MGKTSISNFIDLLLSWKHAPSLIETSFDSFMRNRDHNSLVSHRNHSFKLSSHASQYTKLQYHEIVLNSSFIYELETCLKNPLYNYELVCKRNLESFMFSCNSNNLPLFLINHVIGYKK